MPETHLIASIEEAVEIAPDWDALAVADSAPQMAPGWIVPWWTHLAPATAEPRFVAVYERDELIGLAPFYAERRARYRRLDYRLPGIELTTRLTPLSKPGREWEVARSVSEALAAARPRPDVIALEGSPAASHWPAALREGWPSGLRRPVMHQYSVYPSPTVSLGHESYEAWLATKSAHFREHMRKARRKFVKAGGETRNSSLQTLEADVDALLRLHQSRWASRGDSSLIARREGVRAMLLDVGARMLESGRCKLMLLEIDGKPISAHFLICAGGEVLGINGGWDENWARLSPTVVHCLQLVEESIALGESRIDLGVGNEVYKRRIADGNDPVAWTMLLIPGWRLPLTRLRTAPVLGRQALRATAKRVLTPEQASRMRSTLRKVGGRR